MKENRLPIKIQLDDDFFKEEVRLGYRIDKQSKEIWAIQLDLLAHLDRICKKYDIKFFADGGTVLGALRHKGFIPWDDDIDIVMLRSDYDRLLEVAPGELEKPYQLQCNKTDKYYVRGHAQLRNSETCMALPHEAFVAKFNQGVFLDIFVLDGYSEDDAKRKEQMTLLKKQSGRLYGMTTLNNKNNMNKNKLRYIARYVKRWVYANFGMYGRMYDEYEAVAKRYEGSDYIGLLTFYKNDEDLLKFRREWYDKAVYMPFENTSIPVATGYDNVMKAYYGDDYMTPKNIPSFHSAYGEMIIDTHNSYKKVLRAYKKNKN